MYRVYREDRDHRRATTAPSAAPPVPVGEATTTRSDASKPLAADATLFRPSFVATTDHNNNNMKQPEDLVMVRRELERQQQLYKYYQQQWAAANQQQQSRVAPPFAQAAGPQGSLITTTTDDEDDDLVSALSFDNEAISVVTQEVRRLKSPPPRRPLEAQHPVRSISHGEPPAPAPNSRSKRKAARRGRPGPDCDEDDAAGGAMSSSRPMLPQRIVCTWCYKNLAMTSDSHTQTTCCWVYCTPTGALKSEDDDDAGRPLEKQQQHHCFCQPCLERYVSTWVQNDTGDYPLVELANAHKLALPCLLSSPKMHGCTGYLSTASLERALLHNNTLVKQYHDKLNGLIEDRQQQQQQQEPRHVTTATELTSMTSGYAARGCSSSSTRSSLYPSSSELLAALEGGVNDGSLSSNEDILVPVARKREAAAPAALVEPSAEFYRRDTSAPLLVEHESWTKMEYNAAPEAAKTRGSSMRGLGRWGKKNNATTEKQEGAKKPPPRPAHQPESGDMKQQQVATRSIDVIERDGATGPLLRERDFYTTEDSDAWSESMAAATTDVHQLIGRQEEEGDGIKEFHHIAAIEPRLVSRVEEHAFFYRDDGPEPRLVSRIVGPLDGISSEPLFGNKSEGDADEHSLEIVPVHRIDISSRNRKQDVSKSPPPIANRPAPTPGEERPFAAAPSRRPGPQTSKHSGKASGSEIKLSTFMQKSNHAAKQGFKHAAPSIGTSVTKPSSESQYSVPSVERTVSDELSATDRSHMTTLEEYYYREAEEALSKAKIRMCPNCHTPLLKEASASETSNIFEVAATTSPNAASARMVRKGLGCNRIQCPTCQHIMCYSCRKPVDSSPQQAHLHFCPHDTRKEPCWCQNRKCPLWTSPRQDELRDERRLERVAHDLANRVWEESLLAGGNEEPIRLSVARLLHNPSAVGIGSEDVGSRSGMSSLQQASVR